MKIMGQYDELVTFLNNLDDFFIEVEGKADKIKNLLRNTILKWVQA